MTPPPKALATALADRYAIERELGQGGMATVYLAQDIKHDRKVALKVLKPELAAVLGAERFVVEIKTTAALQHPHILPLFDSGEANGFLYYVMPFIDGETLRTKLDRETQLGIEDAVRITSDVASALHYAHTHGVIHRDIKPENILLHDGRPMVADFGIALAVSAAAGGRMTETGLSLGTPHYMSPEQATAAKDITARSDVYSLGSVLYEMLTGSPPHVGASAQQIIMKIVTEEAAPVTKLRKSVPPHIADAVGKSLEKLPADRFESAKAFSSAINDAAYRSERSATAVVGSARPQSMLRRVLPWSVAAVAIAAYAVVPRGTASDRGPKRFIITPTAFEANATEGLAVSPDGRMVAFAGTIGGVRRIYLRSLADPMPRPLEGTEGVNGVVFSPDGRWLLFSSTDDRIKKVPVDGGAAETLARTTVPQGLTWGASVGPVFGMPTLSPEIRGLTTIPEQGDTALKVLTQPDGDGSDMDHWPYALEDGRAVLFTRIGARRVQLGIYSSGTRDAALIDLDLLSVVGVSDGLLIFIDLDGNLMAVRWDAGRRTVSGDPMRVGDIPGRIAHAVLSSTGTLVMQLAPSAFHAVLVDERGDGNALLPDTLRQFSARFSPDGRRIALVGDFVGSMGSWLYDRAGGTLTRQFDAAMTPHSFRIVGWSTDGRRVLLQSARQVAWGTVDDDGATTIIASYDDLSIVSVDISRDERSLVIGTAFGEGGHNVLTRRLDGDTTLVPFAAGAANETAPRFAPDGRWITYASDESGRSEVYAKPYPGPGARVQVSVAGGEQPLWSKDGTRLFYRSGRAMMAADLGRDRPTSAIRVLGRRRLFTGDFISRGGFTTTYATYDVAPDGKHFLMGRALDGDREEIMVWTDWLPELKRRMAAR